MVLNMQLGTPQGPLLFYDSGKGCIHPDQHIADHVCQAMTSRHLHVAPPWCCVMSRPRTEAEHGRQQPLLPCTGSAASQGQKQCYDDCKSAACHYLLDLLPLSISLAAVISAAAQHQVTSCKPKTLSRLAQIPRQPRQQLYRSPLKSCVVLPRQQATHKLIFAITPVRRIWWSACSPGQGRRMGGASRAGMLSTACGSPYLPSASCLQLW